MYNLDNAAYGMRVYQNFACPYEIAEDATFMCNEAHSQLQTESSASISEVSVPSIARQRNNHYESDSQYVCLIRNVVLFDHC